MPFWRSLSKLTGSGSESVPKFYGSAPLVRWNLTNKRLKFFVYYFFQEQHSTADFHMIIRDGRIFRMVLNTLKLKGWTWKVGYHICLHKISVSRSGSDLIFGLLSTRIKIPNDPYPSFFMPKQWNFYQLPQVWGNKFNVKILKYESHVFLNNL